MKFLLLFEDGDAKQCDFVGPEDYESVRCGYLEVIRYEDGQFKVLDADEDTWHVIKPLMAN